MYRDRKGYYHRKPRNIKPKERESAYGIFIKNSKILLVKPHWIDIWELPGGGKNSIENLIEALKREFLEETGFEILQLDEIAIHNINKKFYADDLKQFFDSKMYFFKIIELGYQNKSLINKEEIKDLRYIQLSDLNDKNMNKIHLDVIRNINP